MPLFIILLINPSISAQSFEKCHRGGGGGGKEEDKDGHHLDVQSCSASKQGKYLPNGTSKSTKTGEHCRIKLALKLGVLEAQFRGSPNLSGWCLLSWPTQENNIRNDLETEQ